jgi:hypothetical protein
MGDQRTSIELDLNNEKDKESESKLKDADDVAQPAVPESADNPSVAPDGGWGWVVVLASFLISVVVDGICYTFGVIKPDLEKHFETSSSTTAWAGSLLGGFYLIAGSKSDFLSVCIQRSHRITHQT